MIAQSWVKKQVFSMTLSQIKKVLDRKRLRLNRNQIVDYLMALLEQQVLHRHYKSVHAKQSCGVGYAAFMHGMGLVAPLWRHLEHKYRQDHAIGFDDLTIADSSLLPSKNEQSITRKDWKNGNATVRPDHKICGEKCLTLINSRKQIVTNQLMPNINSPDDHVFKQPMQWARKGLRFGHLLVDRGFSNKAVRLGIDFLTNALPDYSLGLISPPRARQTWVLTPEQTLLYKKRWQIEEVFRQLKDPQGRFRMVMCGVRRRPLREARVAIATLAWNMEHAIA